MEIVFAFVRLERGRRGWSWTIPKCPLCNQLHSHGGGVLDEDPRTYLTARVSHCVDNVHRSPHTVSIRFWLTEDESLHGVRLTDADLMHLAGVLRIRVINTRLQTLDALSEEFKRREMQEWLPEIKERSRRAVQSLSVWELELLQRIQRQGV